MQILTRRFIKAFHNEVISNHTPRLINAFLNELISNHFWKDSWLTGVFLHRLYYSLEQNEFVNKSFYLRCFLTFISAISATIFLFIWMQYKTSQISYFTQLLTKISKIRFLALSFFYFLGWGGMGYGSRWVLVDKEKISFGKHKLKNRVFKS